MHIIDPAPRPAPAPGPSRPGTNASRSPAIDVTLAEFAALRSEIDNLANAQRTMMHLNITVVAAIAGFVLADRANPRLLLAIPLASSAIGFVYQWYILHGKRIGDYINETLRPILVEHTGDDRVLAWEHQLRTRVYAKPGSRLAGRLAYVLLFPAIPAVSLAAVIPYLGSGWHWGVWALGAVLSVAQVTMWIWQVRDWSCWA